MSPAANPGWRANWATITALMTRSKNELVRVPGAAIPGVLAPTIFFLGLNGVFGALTQLRGFDTSSYLSFIIPVSMLQGAGFTGASYYRWDGPNRLNQFGCCWFAIYSCPRTQ